MEETYLKPCPFCGSSDIRAEANIKAMLQKMPCCEEVFCDDCGATIAEETQALAVAAWNRRTP